ncbi:MAG TPA: DUF2752 domain-containing protein [Bryobacteraceae bacterium]|nr:DUF2752 domain-containing protein [Bryobacteraceae bacterium]
MLLRALRVVTVILALVAGAVLVAAAVLDSSTLDRGVLSRLPACSARRAGGSCALCGMSHSLIALSNGDWREAVRWNPGGPWLYGVLVLQVTGGLWVLVTARRRSDIIRGE